MSHRALVSAAARQTFLESALIPFEGGFLLEALRAAWRCFGGWLKYEMENLRSRWEGGEVGVCPVRLNRVGSCLLMPRTSVLEAAGRDSTGKANSPSLPPAWDKAHPAWDKAHRWLRTVR